MKNIETMKLYHNPERIYNELEAIGYKKNIPLKVEDLSSFDQYHYMGTDALDDAIRDLNIQSDHKIIDIGSGIGGPARYTAEKTGCHVTALELQSDLNDVACSLTQRCGLSNSVKHICGNILEFPEKYNNNFDYIITLLCFLHIPDRLSIMKKCYDILKPNGKIFIEDFYKCSDFDEKERRILSEDVYCDYLPTSEEYRKQLLENGFTEIKVIDKTNCWKNFVKERLENFIKNREDNLKTHDIKVIEKLEDFYKKMSFLFESAKLGGLRIIAGKA